VKKLEGSAIDPDPSPRLGRSPLKVLETGSETAPACNVLLAEINPCDAIISLGPRSSGSRLAQPRSRTISPGAGVTYLSLGRELAQSEALLLLRSDAPSVPSSHVATPERCSLWTCSIQRLMHSDELIQHLRQESQVKRISTVRFRLGWIVMHLHKHAIDAGGYRRAR